MVEKETGDDALETEIAEPRKAERLLPLREAQLRDFLESAAVAMHWVAADGTILWANKEELKLLGYHRDEYVGHSISEFHVIPAATLSSL